MRLYMPYVDLQKIYDSVDREVLWKVLARITGCAHKLIANYTTACEPRVRMDDQSFWDWFEVTRD